MTSKAIEITDLTCKLGGKTILDKISFHVEKSEYLAIVGPNGAGKSTLLKCIARLLPTPKNQIQVLGKAASYYPNKEYAKIIGYVSQHGFTSIQYTVLEFVLMARYAHGNIRSAFEINQADRELVKETLEQVGIAAFANRTVESLSGGERQMVFIAAVMAQDPQIILLDEPTSHLDYKHRVIILDLIERLNCEFNKTIITTTHEISEVFSATNRILALKNGKLLKLETTRDFLNVENLTKVFDTPFEQMTHPTTGKSFYFPVQ